MRAIAASLAIVVALAASPVIAAEHVIVLNNMAFGAVPDGVRAGDTIVWRNDDIFAHTATASDDSFDIELPAGQSVSMIVGAAGSIAFYCRYHPGMEGTLLVEP